MTTFDLAEDARHFSNRSLVTASLDAVVSKKADAVYAVGEDVRAELDVSLSSLNQEDESKNLIKHYKILPLCNQRDRWW